MAKYKVLIKRVEYYSYAVVVEAADLDKAVEKVQREWENEDYLYEKATDILDDASTEFLKAGLAKEEDIKNLINID